MTTPIEERIRQARGRFACMAAAYFLGVFNDNFFKQAAMMLAVAAGLNEMQGYALMAFTVPFLVLAAPAGWCADRFSKHHVVIAAKVLELVAMLFGAAGLLTGHWGMMFAMLLTMGVQAAVFSPALNGSIPELYPEEYVPRANGILRVLITVGILSGIGTAGVLLDRQGTGWWGFDLGRLLVAGTVIGVATAGVVVSFGVVSRPAADPRLRFPWGGPLQTVRDLLATGRDPVLAVSIGADVFIWFVGSLELLLINPMGLQEFGLSKSLTSMLLVSQLAGIGAGGLAGSRLVRGERWYRWVGPLGLGLSVAMAGVASVPRWPAAFQLPALFTGVFLLGGLGGAILVPIESFLQVRPPRERKGTVWAAANFVVFGGILVSGFVANHLNATWQPTVSFAVLGAASIVASVVLAALYRHVERRSPGHA